MVERAAVGHGVAGVDAEIEQNLVELRGVADDGPEVAAARSCGW